MISVYPSDSITYNWIITRCIWFSHVRDIPVGVIIPFECSYYGNLVAFTSSNIKDQIQQELIHYLTKCNENYTKFTDSCIGTDWKGLVRKNNRPELVFAESDAEWFLLQCKYPDIIRVY